MKRRRFRVSSLAGTATGATLALPVEEAKHANVLRLVEGAEIEVFDDAGNSAQGVIAKINGAEVTVALREVSVARTNSVKLSLGVAWPKGKRAAMLVEKCSELGVDEIIPVRFDRSVVTKDEESEGIARLKRIAAEAAKQSGRNTVPEIGSERSLGDLLVQSTTAAVLKLDPAAEIWLNAQLAVQYERAAPSALLLIVGPEGGFSTQEEELMTARKVAGVRLARHVLRIETAAIAAAAITRAFFDGTRLT